MKVLVLKRDKIGDMLLTTPLLARLKAAVPGVETHLLANDYKAWVVAGNPHVDRLWVLEENVRARRFYERHGWRPDGRTGTSEYPPHPVELGYTRRPRRAARRLATSA